LIENLPPPPIASVPTGQANDFVGFIHGPTLAHASAAAVLRNSYVSGADPSNNFSSPVDLSSVRLRRALALLEGIRHGLTINSLLGYRFERKLHDLALDKYIQPFRDAFPIQPSISSQQGFKPVETTPPRDVVDGYVLEQAWLKLAVPWGNAGLPAANTIDGNSTIVALDDLVDTMDCVNDLSVAESAYQFVRRNYAAASGIMDALGQAKRPPQPEIVSTPKSGVGVTNRMIMVLPKEKGNPSTPRGQAEPRLNAWVGSLLGDLSKVGCTVATTNVDPNVDGKPQPVTLDKLGLEPLDVLYQGVLEGQPGSTEIESRISDYVLSQYKVSANSSRTINFDQTQLPPGATTTFPQLLELARAIRAVVNGARTLAMSDLRPTSQVQGGTDFTVLVKSELNNRAKSLLNAAQSVSSDLHNDLSGLGLNPDADPKTVLDDLATLQKEIQSGLTQAHQKLIADLPDRLRDASAYGIVGSIPVDQGGMPQQDPTQLVNQSLKVYQELDLRVSKVLDAQKKNPTPSDSETPIEWIKTLLSKDFPVLPQFSYSQEVGTSNDQSNQDEQNLADIKSSLSSANLVPQHTSPFAWFQQISHIRDRLRSYSTMMTYAELLGTGATLGFDVAQLPYGQNDSWIELPMPPPPPNTPKPEAPSGMLSLVFAQPSDGIDETNLSGLVIDDWNEVIPSNTEVTGLAYHYPDPASEAPQTMLLALPPVDADNWDLNYLVATLNDAFDLAKIRCVDPDQPTFRNQFLPALMFADNVEKQTIAVTLGVGAVVAQGAAGVAAQ